MRIALFGIIFLSTSWIALGQSQSVSRNNLVNEIESNGRGAGREQIVWYPPSTIKISDSE